MKYKLNKLEHSQVEIILDYNNEEWAGYIQKSYEENKAKYNVVGFRKGHAPKSVIEKNYGREVFMEAALNKAFSNGYMEVLNKEKDLDPIEDPKVEIKKLDENSLSLQLIVTVQPEVKLGAYTGLEVERKEKKATKKEIDHEINHAREDQARIIEVEKALENGDIATMDFSGSIDGVKFDGGTASNYDLEIGSHSFIAGFEEQMIGMKKDDKKDVKVKFPAEYGAKELADKDAIFEVTVHAVKQKQLPEVDDDFAKDVSEFETLEEYKNDIKKNLNEINKKNADKEVENTLIDMVVKASDVEVPEVLVAKQQDAIMHDMEHSLMHQGLKLADYAKYLGKTVEDLRAERREDSLNMAKIRIVLEAIVKAEKITVSDKEVEEKIAEEAKEENTEVEEYKKSLDENTINYIKNDILMAKLFSLLKTKNTVK